MREGIFLMSESYNSVLRDQNASLDMPQRIARIRQTWGSSIINFCLIYMLFLGLIFILNPIVRVIPAAIGWGLWGNVSLFFFGVLFIVLSIYGALFPERGAGSLATVVLSGLGFVTSVVVQFNPIGVLFWTLAAAGAVIETIKRVRTSGKSRYDDLR